MSAVWIFAHWDVHTWFDLLLCLATVVEAGALLFLYRLERRQDERDTRVELPIRLYESDFPDQDGTPTCWPQALIEVMNCSATAVYIEKVGLEAEIENDRSAATTDKAGTLVKPFSAEKINVVLPLQRVVQKLVSSSEDRDQFLPALLRVTLTYRAYGKLRDTEAASFTGEINRGN